MYYDRKLKSLWALHDRTWLAGVLYMLAGTLGVAIGSSSEAVKGTGWSDVLITAGLLFWAFMFYRIFLHLRLPEVERIHLRWGADMLEVLRIRAANGVSRTVSVNCVYAPWPADRTDLLDQKTPLVFSAPLRGDKEKTEIRLRVEVGVISDEDEMSAMDVIFECAKEGTWPLDGTIRGELEELINGMEWRPATIKENVDQLREWRLVEVNVPVVKVREVSYEVLPVMSPDEAAEELRKALEQSSSDNQA